MLACHAGGPGSIPGRCMTVLISTQFNDSWFIPGGQAQDKRSMDIDQGTYVQFINVNNKIRAIPIRQILSEIRNLSLQNL